MKLSTLCLLAFLCTFAPANIQKDMLVVHPYRDQQYELNNEKTLDLEKSILQIGTPSLGIPEFHRRDMNEGIESKALGKKKGTVGFNGIGLKLSVERDELSNTGRSTPVEKFKSLSDIPDVLKERKVFVVFLLKLGLRI